MHLVENLDKDQISAPSSFKYRIALEKQVKNLNGLHMSRYAVHILGLGIYMCIAQSK